MKFVVRMFFGSDAMLGDNLELHRHGIYAVRPHLTFFELVNLIYQIGVDVSVEEIIALNFEMAEDLCRLEKIWENVIVFEYTSWHKGGKLQ